MKSFRSVQSAVAQSMLGALIATHPSLEPLSPLWNEKKHVAVSSRRLRGNTEFFSSFFFFFNSKRLKPVQTPWKWRELPLFPSYGQFRSGVQFQVFVFHAVVFRARPFHLIERRVERQTGRHPDQHVSAQAISGRPIVEFVVTWWR